MKTARASTPRNDQRAVQHSGLAIWELESRITMFEVDPGRPLLVLC